MPGMALPNQTFLISGTKGPETELNPGPSDLLLQPVEVEDIGYKERLHQGTQSDVRASHLLQGLGSQNSCAFPSP